MAGQTFTWQVSKPNIGTGAGRVSSAYNKNNKSPLTTITTINPTGYVPVNSSSSDPIVKKLSYAVRTDGVITYQYDDGTGNKISYNSIQELANDFGISGYSATTSRLIQSAMQSNLTSVAQEKKVGSDAIANLPATAAQSGTGPEGNQVGTEPPLATESIVALSGIPDSSDSQKIDDSLNVDLVYPTAIRNNDQDRVKFTALLVGSRKSINATADENFSLGTRNIIKALGSVTLPIQPSITDSNGVEWGGSTLNPIQAYAASKSLGIAVAGGNIAGEVATALNEAATDFKKNLKKGLKEAIQIYFAQEAVGAQNLLSRTSGAVLNPNLELLFNGPTLRPFSFTFRLSPRSQKEANEVKGIINFFKKAMAVKVAESQIFLKTPNIFKIEYQEGNSGKLHDSLNRIKECALLGCDVDYTPDGTYMTFNDEGKTMTSYQLTLRFSELDPVYNTDYSSHQIGY
jgi:hypothetical protein